MTESTRRSETEYAWERGVISVQTKHGSELADALLSFRLPGIAVTHHQFGHFAVTHVPSGRKLCGPFTRYGSALLHAVQCALILNWDRPMETVVAEVKARGDEPVPFAGTKVIERGIERPMTVLEFVQSCMNWVCNLDEFPWESESESPEGLAIRLFQTVAEGSIDSAWYGQVRAANERYRTLCEIKNPEAIALSDTDGLPLATEGKPS